MALKDGVHRLTSRDGRIGWLIVADGRPVDVGVTSARCEPGRPTRRWLAPSFAVLHERAVQRSLLAQAREMGLIDPARRSTHSG